LKLAEALDREALRARALVGPQAEARLLTSY